MKLQDHLAIITGGGRGMGRADCLLLAKEGATVISLDKNGENARNVAGIIEALAKVTRPQNSVLVPVSTPPIPRTQPAIADVRTANHRLTELSARARQT